jgi:hypothetical protein
MIMMNGPVGAMIAIDVQQGEEIHHSVMWTDSPKLAEWKKSTVYLDKLKGEFKAMGLEILSIRSIESVESELDTPED